jgi:uncharacterized protein YndB with AHSA1/START domain
MVAKGSALEKQLPTVEITRVFDEPRELVFKAWTEPERMKQWAVVGGFTMPICEIEPRAGGGFRYCRRSTAGVEYWQKGVYREMVVPERIVLTEFGSDADGNALRNPTNPNWPLKTSSTLTFSEDRGKTILTIRMAPESPTEAERKTFEAAHDLVQKNVGAVLDVLAEYLAKA